jgi:hypothetical protein
MKRWLAAWRLALRWQQASLARWHELAFQEMFLDAWIRFTGILPPFLMSTSESEEERTEAPNDSESTSDQSGRGSAGGTPMALATRVRAAVLDDWSHHELELLCWTIAAWRLRTNVSPLVPSSSEDSSSDSEEDSDY